MTQITWEMLEARAQTLLQRYREAGLTIVTAESCTGGLVAGVLTAIPGSSDVVDRGFVTYTNQAKTDCLGIPAAILEIKGAVSAETAEAMATGALKASPAGVSVSITGVAGPGGGSAEKPVGLVQFGSARRDGKVVLREMRFG
ncbi:MAG: CinA family protein, partial [Hyphomicrobiales bacterium]|nr:CinA family protein [Hyphomicrobiales bacterium]